MITYREMQIMVLAAALVTTIGVGWLVVDRMRTDREVRLGEVRATCRALTVALVSRVLEPIEMRALKNCIWLGHVTKQSIEAASTERARKP